MPDAQSPRHNLPYLSVTQALKEVTHNEALFRIDALLHTVVEARLALPSAPASTDAGKCWLVAPGASGDWQGKDNNIALWTGGSWRFQRASDGMTIRNRQSRTNMVWNGTNWISAPAIADPQSGTVVDLEARAVIAELLIYLRLIGAIKN